MRMTSIFNSTAPELCKESNQNAILRRREKDENLYGNTVYY